MKAMTKRTLAITVLSSLFLSFAGIAFAQWNQNATPRPFNQYCPRFNAFRNGPGMVYGTETISDEDLKKMETLRLEFFKTTQDIRNNIYSKDLEFRSEMAKPNPDKKKLAAIQKEISNLDAQFEQKRISHMLEMRKINPNAGRGMGLGRGNGRGNGRGMGRGMGSGRGMGPGRGMGCGQGMVPPNYWW